jgi:hypothetical protein
MLNTPKETQVVSFVQPIHINIIYFNCLLQEEKKILFYYPPKTDFDKQIINVGLSEAIVKFSE